MVICTCSEYSSSRVGAGKVTTLRLVEQSLHRMLSLQSKVVDWQLFFSLLQHT